VRVIRPLAVLLALAGLFALLPAAAADAQSRRPAPRLTAIKCVPATAAACRGGVRVQIGRQVQLRGRALAVGMRVTFRWPRGALVTKLKRSKAGWVARVPAGVRLGDIGVYVRRSLRTPKSNTVKIKVVAPPQQRAASPVPSGTLPQAFRGNGMWIWQLARSDGGNLDAIAARARAAGISTVFVKAGDEDDRWPQWSTALVQALHDRGLRACAWQFVYGAKPDAEAAVAVDAIRQGADCFVIDAETRYEGRYAEAQSYVRQVRAAVGPDYPIGLTSFPYVDYHPRLPYSVFLGPGGAQANLPQVYWRDIGDTVDAASARTLAQNRVYGRAIAPLGQTYQSPSAEELDRFRAVWAAYGSPGLSWWSWQATSPAGWSGLSRPAPAPAAVPDPGWPALGRGAKGDQVIWMQQHLAAADPNARVTGTFDAATDQALRAFQTARALPPTGTTDPATWTALLKLAPVAVDWAAR
jgi:Putative peptidoglycan binding domain